MMLNDNDLDKYLLDDTIYQHVPEKLSKSYNKLAAYGSTEVQYQEEPVINVKVDEFTGIWTVSGQFQGATAMFTGRTKIEATNKYKAFFERYTTHSDRTEPDIT